MHASIAASWDGRVEAVKQILAHKVIRNTAVLYSAQLLRSYVSDKSN